MKELIREIVDEYHTKEHAGEGSKTLHIEALQKLCGLAYSALIGGQSPECLIDALDNAACGYNPYGWEEDEEL